MNYGNKTKDDWNFFRIKQNEFSVTDVWILRKISMNCKKYKIKLEPNY